jgi:hypothetical protein
MECYRIIKCVILTGGVVSNGFPISGVSNGDRDIIAGVKYGDKYDE